MIKIEWVQIEMLKPNPKNRNIHSEEQIERLAKIIQYQGWRWPIIVSNQSGLVMAGHGRLLAAKKLGLKEVPVSYQDFVTEEQAYAFSVSDNAIASWAELDLSGINLDLPEHGPDFDLDLLGMPNFKLDLCEVEINEKELDENLPTDKECPSCGYKWS